MSAQLTVSVPRELYVFGRWSFSAGGVHAECGESLELPAGPAAVSVTVSAGGADSPLAYSATAELELLVPPRGQLVVEFPAACAAKELVAMVGVLARLIAPRRGPTSGG